MSENELVEWDIGRGTGFVDRDFLRQSAMYDFRFFSFTLLFLTYEARHEIFYHLPLVLIIDEYIIIKIP